MKIDPEVTIFDILSLELDCLGEGGAAGLRVPEREGLVESRGGVCRGDGDGGGGEGADGDSSGVFAAVTASTADVVLQNNNAQVTSATANNYSSESFSHLWQFIMLAFHEQQRKEVYPCGGKLTGPEIPKSARRRFVPPTRFACYISMRVKRNLKKKDVISF